MLSLNCISMLFFLLTYIAYVPFVRKEKARRKAKKLKPRLVWGSVPLINNKYWSQALKNGDYISMTIMDTYYSIFKKEDFDLYYEDIVPRILKMFNIPSGISGLIVFLYAIKNFDIFHHSFAGGFLGSSIFWRLEAQMIHWAGCKSVIIPYGADSYRSSKIKNASFQIGLLSNYPMLSKEERRIDKRVAYWNEKADAVITGRMLSDGFGRTDALPFSVLTIDTTLWRRKRTYSKCDGKSEFVKIIHTPNHRGCKGTEFLVQAVNELIAEGLLVELVLLEGVPNDEVLRIMTEEADFLAEQFLNVGYALSGLEGMACGLPVLANLEDSTYTTVFRRFSYLNECPILSTTPESLKDMLRVLIRTPKLREELGRAGRQYVEKYHSEEAAQYLFGAVYDKIWHSKHVDLINLFHPLMSDYNRGKPLVKHPLIDNRLPQEYTAANS